MQLISYGNIIVTVSLKKKQNLQYILGLSNTEKSYCKFYFKIKELNGFRNWESKVCNTMQAQVFTNQVKIFTYMLY